MFHSVCHKDHADTSATFFNPEPSARVPGKVLVGVYGYLTVVRAQQVILQLDDADLQSTSCSHPLAHTIC